jgi:hypothetical protein
MLQCNLHCADFVAAQLAQLNTAKAVTAVKACPWQLF